jgi:long-subunit acyl-CoA synthetase (AMP-forming)
VLSNGEKFSLAEVKSIIGNDLNVKRALIIGRSHDKATLLVGFFEHTSQEWNLEEHRISIMRHMQEVNAIL